MDSNFKSHHYHHQRHVIAFSIILILLGIVFLGLNIGFLPVMYKPLFSSWPIWCILLGLLVLFKRSYFLATVLLTLGIFFIIPQIGSMQPELNIPADFTHIYWPVLLIVAGIISSGGIYFALEKLFRPRCLHRHFEKFCNSDLHTGKFESEDGFVHISSAFESRKNIVLDPIFKGGEVDSNFGEVILDLRKTTLAEGKTKLNIKVSFGSVVIIVPDEWNVQLRGDSMFGTFSDSRLTQTYNAEDSRILIIDGKCSFGECKLRD